MSETEHSRRVEVFALGGTIAMTPAETGGVTVALTAEQLIAGIPGLAETGIAVGVRDFRRVPGASVSLEDVIELSRAIREALYEGAHGIVVTQGTDTIEETSYLLDLYHAGGEPIVVTGAMRNPALAGPDGPANLLGAIVTAASHSATGLGALVVFADEIHAGRRVRKTHSMNVDTFKSPNGGPVGYVVEGVPIVHNRLPHRLSVPLPAPGALPRVGIVPIALGDQGALLEGIEGKVDALVIAAMGVGHVPDHLVARLEQLAAAMPVVLASRTAAGPVLRKTYGFAGSELDLNARGLLPAGYLDAYKVRVLLIAALAAQANRAQIAAAVAVAGGYADPENWPWPYYGRRGQMATITHLNGEMEDYDPRLIPALLAELDDPDEDDEHPQSVSVTDESGWTIEAKPNGMVVWENVEEDDVPGPRHRVSASREEMARLLRLIGEGEIAAIEAMDWAEGYG